MVTLDPTNADSFAQRFVLLPNGKRYHTVDQAPTAKFEAGKDAPVVLCCHGFPDQWYGWRYQIIALAARGFRVIVPSQLGYNKSDKPLDPALYTYKATSNDMDLLLKECGVDGKVFVLGHDWGGMVAWRFADYFPNRVAAVAAISTPYLPPAPPGASLPTKAQVLKRLPNFGYQYYFAGADAPSEIQSVKEFYLASCLSPKFRTEQNKRGIKRGAEGEGGDWVLEGEMEKKVKQMVMDKKSGKLKNTVNDKEFDVYMKMFDDGGFEAPLHWYKTRDLNFVDEQRDRIPPFPASIPALQIPTALDAALTKEMCLSEGVLGCFPGGNLEVKVMEKADHWVLQDEALRDDVTGLLVEFVERVRDGKWRPTGKKQTKL